MLDAVSTGLHSSVVVAQLASKYGISERALWSDWERRRGWVPFVLGLGKFADFADEVGQKLDAVQRAAWSLYLKASNDSSARFDLLHLNSQEGSSSAQIISLHVTNNSTESHEANVKR